MEQNKIYLSQEKLEKIGFYLLALISVIWIIPLLNKGIDVTDTGYYLAKYKYVFDSQINVKSGSILFTEIIGGLFYQLSSSYQILILNIAGWLSYLFSGGLIYITFKRKKRDIIVLFCVFAGLLFSCTWVRMLNYNALSMMFQVIIIVLLIQTIKKDKGYLAKIAGVLLGINVFVRLPNILEISLGLIFLWYYGVKQKEWKKGVKRFFDFFMGAIAGGIVSTGIAIIFLGKDELYRTFVEIFLSATNENNSHSLVNIIRNIYKGFRYGVELWSTKLLVLSGFLFLAYLSKKTYGEKINRYFLNIILGLFLILGIRWGYGFVNPYALFDMAAVFLIVSSFVLMLFPGLTAFESSLAFVVFISEMILAIGTNNGWYYQCVFLMLPLAVSMRLWNRVGEIYKVGKYVKIVTYFMVAVIFAYGVKYAFTYVHRDEAPSQLTYLVKVEGCRGMKTSEGKGRALEELNKQLEQCEIEGESVLAVLGDCPFALVLTDMQPCFSNVWSDLEELSKEQFVEEMQTKIDKEVYPVILISDFDLNQEIDSVEKYEYLQNVIKKYNYKERYASDYFQLFVH